MYASSYNNDGESPRLLFTERKQSPNWALIDEISIALLEQGIGSFDVLQESLASVVLCRLDEQNEEQFNRGRMLKMFKIAQYQIEYLLKSQEYLISELQSQMAISRALQIENQRLSEQRQQPERNKNKIESNQLPLYKCQQCDKIFVSNAYLIAHLGRRHSKQQPQNDNSTKIIDQQINKDDSTTNTSEWR